MSDSTKTNTNKRVQRPTSEEDDSEPHSPEASSSSSSPHLDSATSPSAATTASLQTPTSAPSSSSSSPSSSSTPSSTPSSAASAAAAPAAKKRKKGPLSKEELEALIASDAFDQLGDAEDVPVYDDCDEVRRKLRAFMRTDRMKQTRLLKLLGVQHASWTRFMGYKGKLKGAGMNLYPAAYRFLESLRILEGKPKSAHRKGAEEIFPEGRSTETQSERYLVPMGMVPTMDEWGRVRVVPDHAAEYRRAKAEMRKDGERIAKGLAEGLDGSD